MRLLRSVLRYALARSWCLLALLVLPLVPVQAAAAGAFVYIRPSQFSITATDQKSLGWGPQTFTPSGTYGFVLTPTGKPPADGWTGVRAVVPANLTETPYLSIDIVSQPGQASGAAWSVAAQIPPQGKPNSKWIDLTKNGVGTGDQVYNLAKLYALTGPQQLWVAVVPAGVGDPLTVGWVRLQATRTGVAPPAAAFPASAKPAKPAASLPKTGWSLWAPLTGMALVVAGGCLLLAGKPRIRQHTGV